MLPGVNSTRESPHDAPESGGASDASCVVCGGHGFETACSAPDRLGLVRDLFEVRQCARCGLAVTWPPADEAELARFYPDDYWGESSEPDPDWIARTQREKTRVVDAHRNEGGRLLDVGCGAGFFLRALRPDRWDRFGVEISPRSAAAAERGIGAGRVFAGRLADAPQEAGGYDVVTFWASLEHVTDPARNLEIARNLLKQNGLLVVQVPNFASWQAVRFGGDWFALDVPRHRFHFTPDSLERLVRRTGFEPIELRRRSETHDPHALKQSLKTRLVHQRATLGRARYYLAAPFVKVADWIAGGATLTMVARRA